MTLILDPAPDDATIRRALMVVAHPDDEVLWAGGLLLERSAWSVFVMTLCRASDLDRAPRFQQSLGCLGARGVMGDLDDGPEQAALPEGLVRDTILALAPRGPFDLVLTHNLDGEYTTHRRHMEVAWAVRGLLDQGFLVSDRLWQFAYEDQGGSGLPQARAGANLRLPLEAECWAQKYALITQVYGFSPGSWEARTTPREEAFICYRSEMAPNPRKQGDS